MDSWTFQTYGWNQTQDDVTLVGVDGLSNVLGTTHDIPSREDCLACHAAATRDVGLGFDAIQLADVNLPLTLDDLAAAGEMSANITMATAATPGTTVQRNALGYLHANCAHCHANNVTVGLNMNLVTGLTSVCETNTYLTALTPIDNMAGGCTTSGAASAWPYDGDPPNVVRVAPDSISTSAVHLRMSARGNADQMPPVGTEDPDTLGLMTIQTWIMGGI
jgi:cytochrome c551/c552